MGRDCLQVSIDKFYEFLQEAGESTQTIETPCDYTDYKFLKTLPEEILLQIFATAFLKLFNWCNNQDAQMLEESS